MPYGQLHYPFENKELFENNFPADFVAGEGHLVTAGHSRDGWSLALACRLSQSRHVRTLLCQAPDEGLWKGLDGGRGGGGAEHMHCATTWALLVLTRAPVSCFSRSVFPWAASWRAEGLDQTRGWFYTLMVLSTALFDKPAFKNLVCNGLVLASDGKKMSKRLKNYPVSSGSGRGAGGGVPRAHTWRHTLGSTRMQFCPGCAALLWVHAAGEGRTLAR